MTKTVTVTDGADAEEKISDVVFIGNPDMWVLISKAWSEKEGWMKSTKAMDLPGGGIVLQVTTQQYDNIAEAITHIPGVTVAMLLGKYPKGE